MLVLISPLLGRERPGVTRGERLSMAGFDDHLLRDIGLRWTDLHAVSVERLLPACCSKAAHLWAKVMTRLHKILAPEPVPCCRS